MAERIAVEVVCALAERQRVYRVELDDGATAMQAVEACGIARDVPAGTIDPARLGIFARRVGPDEPLHEGDRVEIYRPLTLDPMEARRRRAADRD